MDFPLYFFYASDDFKCFTSKLQNIFYLVNVFPHLVPLRYYVFVRGTALFEIGFFQLMSLPFLHKEWWLVAVGLSITHTPVSYVCFCFCMKIPMETSWLRLELYKHIVALLQAILCISFGSGPLLISHKCLCYIDVLSLFDVFLYCRCICCKHHEFGLIQN